MTPMTKKDVYEKVKAHFSRPGAVFGYDPNGCVYRGEDDAHSQIRCAFGAILPDDRYHPGMENTIASTVIDGDWFISVNSWGEEPKPGYELTNLFENWDNGFAEFIDEIQQAHDTEAKSNNPSMKNFLLNLDLIYKDPFDVEDPDDQC